MKKFISIFFNHFKEIKLQKQLNELSQKYNRVNFPNEEFKDSFAKIVANTSIEHYPIIVDRIFPKSPIEKSLKNLVETNTFYHLVKNLPQGYFNNKDVNDFTSKLDINLNILLLLTEHYDGKDKVDLVNRCNDIMFSSIFSEVVNLDNTIHSKTVKEWAKDHKIPLNTEIFWKHATFYRPVRFEIYVEQLISKTEEAFTVFSDTLPTFQKYLSDYKTYVENANYRLAHIKQRDLKVINDYHIKYTIDQAISTPTKKSLKMNSKI